MENRIAASALGLTIFTVIAVTALFFTVPDLIQFSQSYAPKVFWSLYSLTAVVSVGIPLGIVLRLLNADHIDPNEQKKIEGTRVEAEIQKIVQETPDYKTSLLYIEAAKLIPLLEVLKNNLSAKEASLAQTLERVSNALILNIAKLVGNSVNGSRFGVSIFNYSWRNSKLVSQLHADMLDCQ